MSIKKINIGVNIIIEILIVREGISMFGEIATKYENKTNIPLT